MRAAAQKFKENVTVVSARRRAAEWEVSNRAGRYGSDAGTCFALFLYALRGLRPVQKVLTYSAGHGVSGVEKLAVSDGTQGFVS